MRRSQGQSQGTKVLRFRPMIAPSSQVTRLLQDWSIGDPEALDRLLPMVIDEIRDMARRALSGESPHHSLQPTALVNEVYLRLVDRKVYWWKDRSQFFACLSELMRRILVDHARRRRAQKRGSGEAKLSLDEALMVRDGPHPDILALDDALEELYKIDERRYRIVMLWFFVGLTQQEIADELSISVNTVGRQWQTAKRWLQQELSRSEATPDDAASAPDDTDPPRAAS